MGRLCRPTKLTAMPTTVADRLDTSLSTRLNRVPMMVLGYVFSVPFFLLTVRTSQKEGQKASLCLLYTSLWVPRTA